jgi:hypothetical protein
MAFEFACKRGQDEAQVRKVRSMPGLSTPQSAKILPFVPKARGHGGSGLGTAAAIPLRPAVMPARHVSFDAWYHQDALREEAAERKS